MLSIHFDMQGHGNQISALEVRNCRKSGDKVTEPKKPETEVISCQCGAWKTPRKKGAG